MSGLCVATLRWLTSGLRGVQTFWFKVIWNSDPWLLPSELLQGEIPAATTPVFLPGKSHGRRSLVGCSLWGHKELDTERLHFHFSLEWLPWEALPPSPSGMLPISVLVAKLEPLAPLPYLLCWVIWALPSYSSYRAPCPCLQEPLVSLTSSHLPHLAEGHRGTSRIPPCHLKSNVPPHIPLGPQPSPTVAWLQSLFVHVGHINSLLPEVEMEIETSPLPIELLPQPISDSSSVFTFTDMSGDSETAHSGLLSTSPREYLHPHLLLLLPTPALFFLFLLNKLGASLRNARNTRDTDSIPGLRGFPWGGHGNLLWCSCLENPIDREDWWATVHRVAKSWRPLSAHVETSLHILPCLLYMMAKSKYSSDTQPCFFICQWKFGEFIVKERKNLSPWKVGCQDYYLSVHFKKI